MRFRALNFDYHSEAVSYLRAKPKHHTSIYLDFVQQKQNRREVHRTEPEGLLFAKAQIFETQQLDSPRQDVVEPHRPECSSPLYEKQDSTKSSVQETLSKPTAPQTQKKVTETHQSLPSLERVAISHKTPRLSNRRDEPALCGGDPVHSQKVAEVSCQLHIHKPTVSLRDVSFSLDAVYSSLLQRIATEMKLKRIADTPLYKKQALCKPAARRSPLALKQSDLKFNPELTENNSPAEVAILATMSNKVQHFIPDSTENHDYARRREVRLGENVPSVTRHGQVTVYKHQTVVSGSNLDASSREPPLAFWQFALCLAFTASQMVDGAHVNLGCVPLVSGLCGSELKCSPNVVSASLESSGIKRKSHLTGALKEGQEMKKKRKEERKIRREKRRERKALKRKFSHEAPTSERHLPTVANTRTSTSSAAIETSRADKEAGVLQCATEFHRSCHTHELRRGTVYSSNQCDRFLPRTQIQLAKPDSLRVASKANDLHTEYHDEERPRGFWGKEPPATSGKEYFSSEVQTKGTCDARERKGCAELKPPPKVLRSFQPESISKELHQRKTGLRNAASALNSNLETQAELVAVDVCHEVRLHASFDGESNTSAPAAAKQRPEHLNAISMDSGKCKISPCNHGEQHLKQFRGQTVNAKGDPNQTDFERVEDPATGVRVGRFSNCSGSDSSVSTCIEGRPKLDLQKIERNPYVRISNQKGRTTDCTKISTSESLQQRSNKPRDTDIPELQQSTLDTFSFTSRRSVHILCSGEFLDAWADLASVLSSEDWPYQSGQTGRIRLHDSTLVDACGVDVELTRRASIVLLSFSALNDAATEKTTLISIAELTALGRYQKINVLLYYDCELTPSNLDSLARLQNAVLQQGVGQPTSVVFKIATSESLASTLARMILKWECTNRQSKHGELFKVIENSKLCNQASFLLSLVPVLSANGALACLNFVAKHKSPLSPLSSLMADSSIRQNLKLDTTLVGEVHPMAMMQLSDVLAVSFNSSEEYTNQFRY